MILLSFLFSILRIMTPLALTAMGGLIGERSGVIQIGLEGMMLIGALVAAATTHYTQLPWIGWMMGGLGGMAIAALYGFVTIRLRANQIVAGTAINILSFGLAPFICKGLFGSTGSSPSLPIESRFSFEPILITLLIVIGLNWIYQKTALGIFLKFAGEKSEALIAAGVSPLKVRWAAVLTCGILAGFGGASLSIFLSSSYSSNMTAGRGFMALAAVIFGGWKPVPTFLACLFFAFVEALQNNLQMANLALPLQLIQIFPYVVTLLAVAWLGAKSKAPTELGKTN